MSLPSLFSFTLASFAFELQAKVTLRAKGQKLSFTLAFSLLAKGQKLIGHAAYLAFSLRAKGQKM
jgi:hypothetical protein